jgi:hypothetical protein
MHMEDVKEIMTNNVNMLYWGFCVVDDMIKI